MFRIIGCPPAEEWPSKASLRWETFKHHKGEKLELNVPEMSAEGIDLIQVSFVGSRNHSFSSFLKSSEKLTFLNPLYAHIRVRIWE